MPGPSQGLRHAAVHADPEAQREIIMDWLYEEGHPGFSLHDLAFWDYWTRRTGGLSEGILKRRISELLDEGRLDRSRQYNEATRPAGVPKWFYVYS